MKSCIYIILIGLTACSPKSGDQLPAGALLAQVGGEKLYSSEITDQLPEDLMKTDSILYVQSLVDRWTRDQVLLRQAESNVPESFNIDQLIKDYKASLLLANYEAKLIETHLDNSISNIELQEYYDSHKELYILESPIIRCLFVKIDKPSVDIDKIRKWWNSDEAEDFESLLNYCEQNVEAYLLDDKVWHDINEILNELPQGMLEAKNIESAKDLALNSDEYYYFLKVIELVLKKEVAPLSFIKSEASKIILHKRKIALLEKIKNDIYNKAVENREVQIFI